MIAVQAKPIYMPPQDSGPQYPHPPPHPSHYAPHSFPLILTPLTTLRRTPHAALHSSPYACHKIIFKNFRDGRGKLIRPAVPAGKLLIFFHAVARMPTSIRSSTVTAYNPRIRGFNQAFLSPISEFLTRGLSIARIQLHLKPTINPSPHTHLPKFRTPATSSLVSSIHHSLLSNLDVFFYPAPTWALPEILPLPGAVPFSAKNVSHNAPNNAQGQ
jgi:hypothetical protein